MPQPIPGPRGVPLLGNIFDINPANMWASLQTLAEHYGDIFRITVLGHTVVFVAGVALAEEICNEKRFRKFVGGPIVEIRQAVHDALFSAYDDEPSWGIAHRIIAPALTPDALLGHFEEMRSTTAELVELWKQLGPGASLSPFDQLSRLCLEATTLTLYGQKLNRLSGPAHPMIQAMEEATAEAIMRPTRPALLNWLLYSGKFRRAIKTMRAYGSQVVQHRKQNPVDRQDLLARMMEAKDPETGNCLSESQLVDEIVSMPIGSSTAPCLLSTAIYYLLKTPEVLSRARQELDAVVGSGPLQQAHLQQLPYLKAVLRESLRLSFAAPGFNLEPIPGQDGGRVTLAGGKYVVARNQPIIILLSGLNRDPAVFSHPLAFRPERMMGPAWDQLPPGAKKWFGNGRRRCIGEHWAWQWSLIVLAELLRHLDFDMADADYQLRQDGWFNFRPVGFRVCPRPRASPGGPHQV